MNRQKVLLPLVALGIALLAQPAYAHGVGDRYDLPLPLGFFAVGGAAAVVFSFVVVGLVVRGDSRTVGYPRFNLFQYRWIEVALSGPFLWPAKIASLFLLWLVIATALLGATRPVDNFAPTFIWVIWWVGMGFFVAIFGNLWALVNPWKIAFSWAEGLFQMAWPEKSLHLGVAYPRKWGIWPAVILFFAFVWSENAFAESSSPRDLAVMVIVYSAITWAGMFTFGKQQWLRHGEAFSVVYGFLSRFSITDVRVPEPAKCRECSAEDCRSEDGECIDCYECFQYAEGREFNLRPPAVGLGTGFAVTPSAIAMVMLVLASVTFDGFSATPEWLVVQSFFITQFPELRSAFLNGVTTANTLGLVGFPLAFAAVYGIFCYLMYRMVGRRPPRVPALIGAYAFSLIPIALAYNYAHFLSYLLIQGQLIIALASDPFGFGWNLFGTADYVIHVRVTNARFIWIFSVMVIVLGHISGVYLAHIRAMRLYPSQSLVLRSQFPMLGLMVIYTIISLWIVSRPITE
ncbi:MAG TPA: hypothetical protein VFR55_08485 [Dehalococcoidia bacterium]|nr:hypothetical protein [Dehalococcoidia bacterium]